MGCFWLLGRDKRVRCPAETKLLAVEMIRAGYGRDAIAAELGATGSAVKKMAEVLLDGGAREVVRHGHR